MPTDEETKAREAKALDEVRQANDARIAEITNQAITAHLKRFEKAQGESFAKLLEEKLKAFVPPPPVEEPPKGGKKPDPELAAMQGKLDELAKLTNEANDRAAKAEAQRREEHTYGSVRALLKDVRPELQEVAARDLFYAQKRIVYDENGKALFKGRRIPAPGMAEEEVELPLQDGIAQWLKSKEAAAFLPSPHTQNPRGTGARGPSGEQLPGSRRAPNGMPHWDKDASTDEERALRSIEIEQAALAVTAQQGRSS